MLRQKDDTKHPVREKLPHRNNVLNLPFLVSKLICVICTYTERINRTKSMVNIDRCKCEVVITWHGKSFTGNSIANTGNESQA